MSIGKAEFYIGVCFFAIESEVRINSSKFRISLLVSSMMFSRSEALMRFFRCLRKNPQSYWVSFGVLFRDLVVNCLVKEPTTGRWFEFKAVIVLGFLAYEKFAKAKSSMLSPLVGDVGKRNLRL